MASLVERKTRFAVLFRNPDRRSAPLMDRLVTALAPLPVAARWSITFDRGLEFTAWRELDAGMGTKAWLGRPAGALAEGRGGEHQPPGAALAGARNAGGRTR